jgi:anthranilate synthase/aminodeoxychorismate synthase-like glutamine amidotransferase
MRLLVIDNYDSFTYNLVHLFEELGAEATVLRNDAVTLEDARALAPDGVVVSPGPGRPEDAGVSIELIRDLAPSTPILGVCLGHQAIGMAYGAAVVRAEPVHGKKSVVEHTGVGCFEGLPSPIEAGRYHSLAVDRATLPEELEVTATAPDGLVMGVRHRDHPVEGIQFHPESILTADGKAMLANWLRSLAPREERAD